MFSLKQLQEIADSRVQTLVESGTLDNAKPIYYHPILIDGYYNNANTLPVRVNLVILDNSSTAYTESTGMAKLKELMDLGALINVNGYFSYTENQFAFLDTLYKVGSEYRLSGARATSTIAFDIDVELTITNFVDGVNKIN